MRKTTHARVLALLLTSCGSAGDDTPGDAVDRYFAQQASYVEQRCACHLSRGDFATLEECKGFLSFRDNEATCLENNTRSMLTPELETYLACFGAQREAEAQCWSTICPPEGNAPLDCLEQASGMDCGDLQLIAPGLYDANWDCNQVDCADGTILMGRLYCNGTPDCPDASDESDCP